jgi:hypothetical protein
LPTSRPPSSSSRRANRPNEATQKSERERDLEERRRLAEEALGQSRRVVQRTRIGAAVAFVLALAAAGAGLYAFSQKRTAVA